MNPQKFFFENAAISWDPKRETKIQGRIRTSNNLARAEKLARENGWSFEWRYDEDINSSDFTDEKPAWKLWRCILHLGDGSWKTIGGVDFGPEGTPWRYPYRRVVEAELAAELLEELEKRQLRG